MRLDNFVLRPLIVLAAMSLAFTTSASAITKMEAGNKTREFLRLLLAAQHDELSTITSGDTQQWADTLTAELPPTGGQLRFAVLGVRGSKNARESVVKVHRGDSEQIFYIRLTEDRVTEFVSIFEIIRVEVPEVRENTQRIEEGLDRFLKRDLDARSLANLLRRHANAIERYANLLVEHEQWLDETPGLVRTAK